MDKILETLAEYYTYDLKPRVFYFSKYLGVAIILFVLAAFTSYAIHYYFDAWIIFTLYVLVAYGFDEWATKYLSKSEKLKRATLKLKEQRLQSQKELYGKLEQFAEKIPNKD